MKKLICNENGRYLPADKACLQINVSRNTLMKIAAECNAVVRFGRSVRIDMVALNEYIEVFCKERG